MKLALLSNSVREGANVTSPLPVSTITRVCPEPRRAPTTSWPLRRTSASE